MGSKFRLWLLPLLFGIGALLLAATVAVLPVRVGKTGQPVPPTDCGSVVSPSTRPASPDAAALQYDLVCQSQLNSRRAAVLLNVGAGVLLLLGAVVLKRGVLGVKDEPEREAAPLVPVPVDPEAESPL